MSEKPPQTAPAAALSENGARVAAERALAASEARYRALVESIPAVTYVVAFDPLRVVYVSPQTQALLGCSADDWVRTPGLWVSMLHPEDRERVLAEYSAARAQGGVFESEYRLRLPDGRTAFIHDSARIVPGEHGAPLVLQGLMFDVTASRAALEQLRAGEERLQLLLDQLPAVVWSTDGQLRFTSSKGAGLAALGRKPDDVVGRTLAEVVGEDEPPDVAVSAARRALRGDTVQYQAASRGNSFDVWVRPLRDERGVIRGTVGAAIDVSERSRAEEMLRRQADLTQRLIDSSVDGILAFDRECRITIWNPALERTTGWTEAEVLGRSAFELFPFLRQTGDDQLFHDALAGRTGVARDRPYLDRSGRSGFFEGHFSPLVERDGSVVGGLAVIRDRTQHRSLEEQLRLSQKMEAVGRLAGGVAHDFSNMLTVISGRSELLLDALPPGDPRHGHAAEILKATRKAAALTHQLLTFSRRQAIQPRVLSVNAILVDMTTLLSRLMGDRIELDLEPAHDLGCVRADPSQVEQVVLNLAVNARDAMPDGGCVRIRTMNVDVDAAGAQRRAGAVAGAHVLIEVKDAGIGMDAATLERIFEPFFTTKKRGTGLGLATVYGIVHQNGGHVSVESAPGRGSTFRVYLPRAAETITDSAEAGRLGERGGSETVLVLEDDAPVRELARLVLERQGYRVLCATGVEDALAIAEENAGSIHLVIADVLFSGGRGLELVARLQTRHLQARALFMSGQGDEPPAAALPDEAALLEKPFTAEGLVAGVRKALDGPPR